MINENQVKNSSGDQNGASGSEASVMEKVGIAVTNKPRKNAAVAADVHRPLRRRRSSSLARRQR